jgi:hypothetical protein
MAASPLVAKYHTSEIALKRRFDTEARQLAFTGRTAAQARAWQARARKRFAELLGLDRFAKCPPRPRKLGTARLDGLVREDWIMRVERDVWMPFCLFVPDPLPAAKVPLVLCPHGHGSSGKWAPSGRSDIPGMKDAIEHYNYDYGVQIARAGFITACSDARGFGERREPALQRDDAMLGSSCHQLMLAGAPLGLTVQGMWTWDLMRLLDLLARDRRVDARRIGCAGLSGGGMQTLDLAALDTRVVAAVDSGYFYGVQQSLQVLNSNCACNLVPDLWESFDMGDIGGLVAPRGLFIESGDEDGLNGPGKLANVRSQIAIARKAYRAFGAEQQLGSHVFHGGHRWDGTASIPWLKRQLAG